MPLALTTVILPGLLRDLVDGEAEIQVESAEDGQTVGSVLDRAFGASSAHHILEGKVRDERGQIRRHVKVFVNGDDVTRGRGVETEVPAGARLHIISAVSGG